jgi:hypothetical protein
MNDCIRNKLPEWVNIRGEYNLCLSDDLDSLWSCYYLTKYRGWPVKYFYDFESIYRESKTTVEKNCIGVDMDICNGKTFSNHVTDNNNENCINLNRYFNISRYNYTRKYAGSTLLMVMSILGIDINKFTPEQQAILLCVDSTYLHYQFNSKLASYYIGEIFQYPELIHILEQHDPEYFIDLQDQYNLKGKIYMDDWNLISTNIKLKELSQLFNIDLDVPQKDYEKIGNFNIGTGVPEQDTKIFSLAWSYRNSAIYSTY